MKKFAQFFSVSILSILLSATAFACPKGTTLSGGTGPKHKGGKCILIQNNHNLSKQQTTHKITTNQPSTHKVENTIPTQTKNTHAST